MIRLRLDYKLVQALDAVVKEQNFDRAAKLLNITQSAVSQRIKQLEQQFAQPLLVRTQPIAATITGQKLLAHFRQISQLEYELLRDIMPDTQNYAMPVAIAVNADSLASWFIPAISPILKQYNIELNVQVCNETKTQLLLKRGEVFAALSNQADEYPGCHVRLVGQLDYILCATPEFQQRYFADGLTPVALTKAPGVIFDQSDSMHLDYIEQHFGIKAGQYPCHTVRSSEAFVDMALAGIAYCLLPHNQAQQHLDAGDLVDLAPQLHLQHSLYWHSWVLEKGIHKAISEQVINYGKSVLL